MTSPASRQRKASGNGELLTLLRGVISRLDPRPLLEGKPDPLTLGDRSFAATVLSAILADNDPRGYFWETLPHRVTNREDGRDYQIAFVYHARIALGDAAPGKTLRGYLASHSGLSDDKIEHIVRSRSADSRNAKVMVDALGVSREQLVAATDFYLTQLSRKDRRRK